MSKWLPEVNQHASHAPKIFIGNKIDLREGADHHQLEHFVSEDQARRTVENAGFTYLECSALTQTGLKNSFNEACRIVMKQR